MKLSKSRIRKKRLFLRILYQKDQGDCPLSLATHFAMKRHYRLYREDFCEELLAAGGAWVRFQRKPEKGSEGGLDRNTSATPKPRNVHTIWSPQKFITCRGFILN